MTNMRPALKNYFELTPKNIVKWTLALKGIIVVASTATVVSGSPILAFWILIAGAALGEFANLFKDDEIRNS